MHGVLEEDVWDSRLKVVKTDFQRFRFVGSGNAVKQNWTISASLVCVSLDHMRLC